MLIHHELRTIYKLLWKDDQNKKTIWALQATTNSGKNYGEVTSCYRFWINEGK